LTNEKRDRKDEADLYVTVQADLKAQFAEVARSEHRTISGLLRLLIEERIARAQRRARA
jgi:CopG-like RHH_1 or ribbon-helix-helix domain, RHH_5